MTRNHGFQYRERIQGGPAPVLEHLARRYRHSTEAQWRARIELGELELDGRPVLAGTLLRPGQELVWHRPPWDEPEVDTAFGLLYQDDLLLAVAKPRGLPTLPGGGYLEHTLLALVRARFPEASPMHRLGRETSGIVLFSRSHAAGTTLQSAWREHLVVKRYRALASGLAREEDLVIAAPIGPVPHPWLGTLFAASAQGKPALSRAHVLERRAADTLFEVLIETGRPHQIRIHLAWADHPLVGDPLYGPGGLPRPDLPALPGDGGYFLHAEHLAFPHPLTGRTLELWAPPPAELRMASERL
ncbi:MAG: pseudouridine synthase [Holophaga sp.]|nr:pseudouridine synthase [Holophaga sp.]